MATNVQQAFLNFRNLELNFNQTFMDFLVTLGKIAQKQNDAENQERLRVAYERWYDVFNRDPKTSAASLKMMEAFEPVHSEVIGRSESFVRSHRALQAALDAPELDCKSLYDSLTDGTGLSVEERRDDGKLQFWNAVTGLYRVAIIINIYYKMPMIRQIIDIVLQNAQDLQQGNLMTSVMTQFIQKPELRNLMFKMFSQGETQFMEIMGNLQKVMDVFSAEIQHNPPPQPHEQAVRELCAERGVQVPPDLFVQFTTALRDRNDKFLFEMVEMGLLSLEDMTAIRDEFEKRELHTLPEPVDMKNIHSTISQTMKAMQQDEVDPDVIENILKSSGVNIDLQQIQDLLPDEGDDLGEEQMLSLFSKFGNFAKT
jgi:hypothetical protein